MIYKSRTKSQSWAGETIGILVLDCHYPFLPGNVANATTYNFPVRYAVVEGATADRLLYQADPTLIEPFIAAAQKLQAEGVKAITGACGFMALFQKEIAAAVDIPVFASSLLQIPFVHQITGKRVGIITADSTCLKPEHFSGTGVGKDIPLAIGGMETKEAFMQGIIANIGELDDDGIREGVVDVARKLQADHDDLGAILLECSDLPPYAHAVQAATGLPVFDFITMINYVHETLARKPYYGLI
ncbi:aspartate/glutamate racemase family protein [Cochlodiniinecator piscidefendens]|uniref:aspartate/glutamate racemase family protein n=1 Tax=Cochlodiniinecator piscidefendens TaxID=2715756 RepID=UPI00140CC1E5|nr:aspartate/glutamate racemase family protein [Cochlodiniinecator piscidefendens]